MIRVLHVVTHMNRGGLETMIMNYYRNIDKKKIQFDFLVHRMERAAYDEEIETLGGYIHRLPVLNPFSLKYRKKLNNFFKEHPEYQIVHVHQDCLSSIILKAAKKNGVRVRIAHSHNANQDKNIKYLIEIIYVFLTIFLYLLKCPQSLILSALRAFFFCGKPHISRSIFLYFRYQAWLKSW